MAFVDKIFKILIRTGTSKGHEPGKILIKTPLIPFSEYKLIPMLKWSHKHCPDLRPLFFMMYSGSVLSVIFMAYKLFKRDIILYKGSGMYPQEFYRDHPWDPFEYKGVDDEMMVRMTKERDETWGLKELGEKRRKAKNAKYT